MEREVRYCTTEDGVRIAYRVKGDGPPLLMCSMLVESFSLHHINPDYEEFISAVGAGRSVIHYDTRGTRLSERDVADLSLAGQVGDIRAVADAAGVDKFSIWAPSASGRRVIRYAAENAERVAALILAGTYARPLDVLTEEVTRGLAAVCRADWSMAARTIADFGDARIQFAERTPLLAAMFERSCSSAVMARFFEESITMDAHGFLPSVQARSLVIHHLDDRLVPLTVGQTLAAALPNGRLVVQPGSTHGFLGNIDETVETINAFLDEEPITRRLDGVARVAEPAHAPFRTVLFTDLVGHTEMMSRLGDARGRDVLREHERITREVLKANGGIEVKTMGDGFMASFGSVTKAVECAIALQRAFAERDSSARPEALEGFNVRVGLNAGEPIEEDGDLFGATVILASRIAAKAEGGEILVADTVRGLCSGKGFLFADRGEFVAKGFEEPVRVYEVRWRDG